MSIRQSFLVTCALLVFPIAAAAQIAIPGAGEDKFGLLSGGRAVTVTTTDSKIALSWSNDPKATADDDCKGKGRGTPAYHQCVEALIVKPRTFLDASVGIVGDKGKKSIFAGGTFAPGLDLGFTIRHQIEDPSPTHGGYTEFFAGVTAATRPLSVATFAHDATTIDDRSERSFGLTGGVNKFLRENLGVGAGLSVKRALGSPGLQKPVSLCTIRQADTTSDAQVVQATKCDDGFIAPLSDQWVASYRLDLLKNFTTSKVVDGSAVESFGIVASFNVAKRTDTDAVISVAAGPTLHPKGAPHKVLAAILFGLSDITDAAKTGRKLKDKFSATLYFGIPLKGF
jgi:hypothetical protein